MNNDVFLNAVGNGDVLKVNIFLNSFVYDRRVQFVQMGKLCYIIGTLICLVISNFTVDLLIGTVKRECDFTISIMESKDNLISRNFLCKLNSCVRSSILICRGRKGIINLNPFSILIMTVNGHIIPDSHNGPIRIVKVFRILFTPIFQFIDIGSKITVR
ncbi:unknown [Candidatus Colimorpha enterica]|uniref:Uncharacterized protein n=1 Tax=Candidatus Colimorpha enterica TaxID=3083063 RepID=R6V4R5_9BACT|nr:unknown [Candidatus Colimorpha enterica]